MVKGATAGDLLVEAIKKAIEFAKEWTIEAAKEAAYHDRAVAITHTLAKAHGDGAGAAATSVSRRRPEAGRSSARDGPLGAAIGAGVGFLAGRVRLLVKGATEKAREKNQKPVRR